MLALVASRSRALTPAAARSRNLPVLLIQGGIHAGEIDGKDAGFLALREILEGRAARGALERLTLVFVPVFNVDGHERFGPWNRPNQIGPQEMGWRVTAQNLNLNRDYTKADAPEMRAMLRLLSEWNPILYVDLHVTDGAQFQHDIANTVEPFFAGDPELHGIGRALLESLNERLAARGALPLDFYPALKNENDPASGFELGASPPRFSTGYWALRNRFAVLVETHSWKDYRTRARLAHDTILALIEMAARDGRIWLDAARAADDRARSLGGRNVPLTFKTTGRRRMIEFKGYAYRREQSAVSGTLALRYDPETPEIWHLPLYDEVVPDIEVAAPRGGYIVPAAHASWMSERLALHGIEYRALDAILRAQSVEVFRAASAAFSETPLEGRTPVTLSGSWAQEERNIPEGSLFVPIAQPGARLLLSLLEPTSPDSLVAWGFFNAHFEAKEYMEDYVAEAVGREMLANDPALAAEFERRLATDPQFAVSPQTRLEFFYRRHPSWDERLNLYPIMRIERAP